MLTRVLPIAASSSHSVAALSKTDFFLPTDTVYLCEQLDVEEATCISRSVLQTVYSWPGVERSARVTTEVRFLASGPYF